MKVARNCVVCHSPDLTRKIGQFAPFISHRVLEYPICKLIYGEVQVFPTLLTNSIRCKSCGFVFSQIRFEDEEMAKIYRDYRGKEYTATRNIFEPGYDTISPYIGNGDIEIQSRQREMERFLVGVVEPSRVKTVLDYGGDKGQHIPYMFGPCTRYVYDISTVETVADIKIANDLTALGVIDFVMASNVFEHLPFPNDAMDAIKSVCGRDTMLFIDVPLEIGENDLSDDQIPAMFHEHINCFTPRSLSMLFNQNGFHVVKIEVILMDLGWTNAKAVYAVARPNW